MAERWRGSTLSPLLAWATLLTATLVVGSGCVPLAMETVSYYAETTKGMLEVIPAAPECLDSSQEETGVILVSAELRSKNIFYEYTYDIDEMHVWAGGELDTLMKMRPFEDGLAVFAGLPPGDYRVSALYGNRYVNRYEGGEWDEDEALLGAEQELRATVEPGRITYIGKVVAFASRSRKHGVELASDPEFERAAFEELLEKYRDCPWTPVIVQHLDELSGDTNG